MKRITTVLWVCTFVLFCAVAARADVTMPALFSDGMVLQRGAQVPIYGWAEDGEEITVTFRNQQVRTKAKNGKWMVKLDKLKAGGPDILVIKGNNTIQIANVLVGEVWICSGQSNMAMTLNRVEGAEAAISNSANRNIRLFSVPIVITNAPQKDVNSAWKECGPGTVADFSAVGYFFGRDLQKALGVPIGLINTSRGGSPAEAWMSEDALTSNAEYKKTLVEPYPAKERTYLEAKAAYDDKAAKAKAAGKKFNQRAPYNPWRPASLYNGMIAPLLPYAIKGAIWYQGENNAPRAEQYRRILPDMIENWREVWGQDDFPFLIVQLAPFKEIKAEPTNSDWAELREAQFLTTEKLPNVGLAVITDVGEERDIHPRKKEPVGQRLALAALGIAYDRDIEFSGPVPKKVKIKDDKVVIRFDHVGEGLEAGGTRLKGFAICGADGKFVWADAKIQSRFSYFTGNHTYDEVVVSSPQVPKPVAVRYGWADFPVVNLFNKEGLPATPFRTDNLPMITANKVDE